MSKVIPKEKLTAYQRWELAPFEDSGGSISSAPRPGGPIEPGGMDMDAEGVQVFPTAEALEHIHQEAWQEGYNLGQEEGKKAGFEAGRQDGEKYARQLRHLAEALETDRLRQDEEVAQEILALAIAVAQQMVGATLSVKPELILSTIREALLSLPTLSGHHRVVVHPDNAQMVREWLDQEHNHLSWKIVEDNQLESGGFKFESAHSELDASMQTRWREIVECLGASAEWLE
jgi:flagellar assembly protein FliH